MKNSVLDRLKSYFNEYFLDATEPTARNLFLIVVSILALDTFRSVRSAHRHVLTKLSDTSLNTYYYALKTDRPDHGGISVLNPQRPGIGRTVCGQCSPDYGEHG